MYVIVMKSYNYHTSVVYLLTSFIQFFVLVDLIKYKYSCSQSSSVFCVSLLNKI